MNDSFLLSRVFDLAEGARREGDHPFGALLAVDGEVIAEARNRVIQDRDVTAHAETQLVRVLEQENLLSKLPPGTVYASCEPCPMCVGALFWAGARRVVYGLSSERLLRVATPPGAEPFGFRIAAAEIGERCTPPMFFSGPHREDEAVQAHLGFWTNS